MCRTAPGVAARLGARLHRRRLGRSIGWFLIFGCPGETGRAQKSGKNQYCGSISQSSAKMLHGHRILVPFAGPRSNLECASPLLEFVARLDLNSTAKNRRPMANPNA
jgi:hypothetical protein